MGWNLARLSCVFETIDTTKTIALVADKLDDGKAYVWGIAQQRFADKINATLNAAAGVTAEQIESGEDFFYCIGITQEAHKTLVNHMRLGKISVLEYEGFPVGYILTNSKATTNLLLVLNSNDLREPYSSKTNWTPAPTADDIDYCLE